MRGTSEAPSHRSLKLNRQLKFIHLDLCAGGHPLIRNHPLIPICLRPGVLEVAIINSASKEKRCKRGSLIDLACLTIARASAIDDGARGPVRRFFRLGRVPQACGETAFSSARSRRSASLSLRPRHRRRCSESSILGCAHAVRLPSAKPETKRLVVIATPGVQDRGAADRLATERWKGSDTMPVAIFSSASRRSANRSLASPGHTGLLSISAASAAAGHKTKAARSMHPVTTIILAGLDKMISPVARYLFKCRTNAL